MNLVISIEKKYFDLMLKGKKVYEFRRKFVDMPCRAFVYVPFPVGEAQGYIEFGKPIRDIPYKINEIALSQGISEDSDILEYLAGAKLGYAIPVKRIKELKHPVSLDYLRKNYAFTAPQNYLIADKKPDLLGYLSSLLG